MLLVIEPFSIVGCFISADQRTTTVAHVVLPLADVVAAISVHHASMAIEYILHPETIVAHTVRPNLTTFAMTLLPAPFAQIHSIFFHFLCFTTFSR